MPLVTIKHMLQHATDNGYALGGFQLDTLDDIAAVLDAAQTCRAPVLLDISQHRHAAADSGMLLAAAEHAARQAGVPVGLVSTEVMQVNTALETIRDGSNGLSIKMNGFRSTDKIAQARSIVQLAAGCGIPVEGLMAQFEDDTEMVSSFADQIDLDGLAFDLDTAGAGLSIQQIARALNTIKRAVAVPLALHGMSALDDGGAQALREAGIASIHFKHSPAAHESTLQPQPSGQSTGIPRHRELIRQYALERMRLLGCEERAVDVLADCARWEPVEHVIMFNVETEGGLDIDTILSRGREVLGEIPGVRYVYTGQAIQSNAAYRFCWLVRFAHPAVIDSYREFPTHKQFADELFRPIAPTRMSIDFYLTTDRGASQSLHATQLKTGKAGKAQHPDQLSAV